MSERPATFGELGTLFDGPHATPTRTTEGPYFLNIASLKAGRLDLAESDHVSARDFEEWTRRVTPRAGDLLFSYETRLGDAALMPDGVEACLGRRMALLRPNNSIVDPRYLLYYFLSPTFQRLIEQNTIHGATVSRIGLASIPSWPVEVAPLGEQRAIAELLGALDDKMVANEAVAAAADRLRLESVDAAVARSGAPRPLSGLARFVNGRAFTKGATGAGRVVIRIAELNSGLGGSTVYSDIEVADDFIARPGDLLFAWSGSLTVARWYRDEAIVNQHIFKVVPSPGHSTWLIDYALRAKLEEFRGVAADKATTMGHIQRRHLDEQVLIPDPESVVSLHDSMAALWSRALAAEMENEYLSATRDELLPLLMSGKLCVKDAEKVVEEVV